MKFLVLHSSVFERLLTTTENKRNVSYDSFEMWTIPEGWIKVVKNNKLKVKAK